MSLVTDGKCLMEAYKVPKAHKWILNPSRLLSGHDFVMSIKLRFNALPVKSRTARGRAQIDRTCRAGCRHPETLNHVLQQCHRTHGPRCDRHEAVANYLQRNLNNKGWRTIKEPVFNTTRGNLKPDIVAIKGNSALILDAQIVADSVPLDLTNTNKVQKYSGGELTEMVRQRTGAEHVKTLAATLNWRGVWSQRSAGRLVTERVVGIGELQLLSTRVLIGGVAAHRLFNRSTTIIRGGIG